MIIKEMLSHFKNQLRPYYKQGLSPHENETLVYKDLCFPNRLFLCFIFIVLYFLLGNGHFLQGHGIQVAAIPFSFYSEQCRTSRLRLHV